MIALLLGLVLAACSPKDQLLGVWEEQGGDLHLRFHTGNTISQKAYFDEAMLTLTGSYELINDSQIRIEFQDGDWQGWKSGLYSYAINGSELTLDDTTFVRQPDVYNLG
jgi:hypothetical protein